MYKKLIFEILNLYNLYYLILLKSILKYKYGFTG